MFESQSQTVARNVLEEKVGRKLSLGDTFVTKTGTWKIVDTNVDEKSNTDLLIVEKQS